MLYTHLVSIKLDLAQHHRNRDKAMLQFVQQRLTKSLASYYKDLKNSTQYLLNRNPENVLRKL